MTSIWMSADVVPARHRIFALALVSVLVALVPLADASPPDPTWLTGIYDAWDFDEVVVAIVSAAAVVSCISPMSPKPGDLGARPQPENAVLFVAAPASPLTIRAPPSSTRIATT